MTSALGQGTPEGLEGTESLIHGNAPKTQPRPQKQKKRRMPPADHGSAGGILALLLSGL